MWGLILSVGYSRSGPGCGSHMVGDVPTVGDFLADLSAIKLINCIKSV